MTANERNDFRAATRLLIDAVQRLSLTRSLPAIQQIARQTARALTGADGATFVLRDGDRCHYADEDAISPLWKGQRFPMSACISGWVMVNREAVVIEDIYADPRIPADAYRPTFVKSLAMVPIRRSEPVGAIGNYWATPHRAGEHELELLQALADSTSIAMENVLLLEGLELRVRERTRELEQANGELEAFSYSVSHDLRAPLRQIRSYCEFLHDDASLTLGTAAREQIGHIHDATAHMGELIDALLALAGVARAALERESVDLSALAGTIVRQLHAREPGRAVAVEIQPGLCARGDTRLLQAMLDNLIGNSWKYTTRAPNPCIRIGRHTDADGHAEFFVADNGAGFDMARVGRIFRPFGRLHRSEDFPGTGVGLATVQRIVHRHGGHIRAEAAPGQGATFFFTLPEP